MMETLKCTIDVTAVDIGHCNSYDYDYDLTSTFSWLISHYRFSILAYYFPPYTSGVSKISQWG